MMLPIKSGARCCALLESEQTMTESISLLVSDREGIYVPMAFVERYDTDLWSNIDPADVNIILEGPDAEGYWDAWDSVLQNAEYHDDNGHVFRLHQDGDLWAVCYELMTEEDKKNFFAE